MMRVALYVVVSAAIALAGVAWLARPLIGRQNRSDKAWKPSRTVVKFSGYDQQKAVTARKAALERDARQRKLAAGSVPTLHRPHIDRHVG